MKYIELTQGQRTIVDDEDFEFLSQWKWFFHKQRVKGGYAARGRRKDEGDGADVIFLHNVLIGEKEGFHADHKNRDKLDNRRLNLRHVTPAQNGRNTGLRDDNKSGFKGVSWSRHRKKWLAQARVNGKVISISLHFTPGAASAAYVAFTKKIDPEHYSYS